MDIALIVLGIILIIAGIVGCIVPLIPGVPLSYLGIIMLHFTSTAQFSPCFLLIWGLIVILVQILDYYIPVWGTKKFGGGSKGAWGSAIGVVVGIFFSPIGIIVCPFIGAVVGELIDDKKPDVALKAGFGAFIGFLAGTVMKLAVSVILAFYFFKEIFSIIF
ncbi:DUF456 domain-containing protein [Dysgonomonas sp. 520]|uniref:DUF456 domain-containing protein n=1 Tax=Dysgonomonas sp. 520 TaxID=2302931 RepID=UPI00162600A5|nr:DUF456 domain-containing protein [Dysgonomonas sp. 520]